MNRSFFRIVVSAVAWCGAAGASAQDAPAAPAAPPAPPTTITATATVSVTVGPADALGSPVVVVEVPAAAPAAPVWIPAPPAVPPPVPLATPPAPPPAAVAPMTQAPPGYVLVVPPPPATPLFTTPPPYVDAPRTRSRFGRIMAEAGIGTAGMLVGTLTGMMIGVSTCGDDSFDDDCTGAMVGGIMLGAGIGTPVGIFLAGNMIDGNGGFGWTLLGTSAGFLVGYGLASASENEASVFLFGLAPLVGGILGYELSSDASARASEQARTGGVQLRASVGPTRGGAAVGLSGTF